MEKDALLIVYIQFYIKDFISALFLEWFVKFVIYSMTKVNLSKKKDFKLHIW